MNILVSETDLWQRVAEVAFFAAFWLKLHLVGVAIVQRTAQLRNCRENPSPSYIKVKRMINQINMKVND